MADINKVDFVNILAGKGYTKGDAAQVIDDVFDTITEILAGGNALKLYGFGTFDIRESAERESVDVRTKERIVIPSHKAPKFTPGKVLRRAVMEGIVRE